jgi:hypothetical protein
MMTQAVNTQLILAVAIVLAALGVFGYLIYSKVRALGLLRDDFDRRAPWLALGVILGGALVYWKMTR